MRTASSKWTLALIASIALAGCAPGTDPGPAGSPAEDEPGIALEGTVAGADGKEESLSANAPRLVVPLLDEDGKALVQYNTRLKAAGMKVFPTYVAIADGAPGRKTYSAWMDYVDEVNTKLGLEIEIIRYSTPDEYIGWNGTKKMKICYSGDGAKIGGLTEGLADNLFSDQYILWGWKYKDQKNTLEDWELEDSAFPQIWRDWRGTGEAVLLVYSTDDSGEHAQTAVVPMCVKK